MWKNDRPTGRNISFLYRQAQVYLADKLKPYNIGSGQYPFLLTLYKSDGISQEELSSRLMLDKGTTARAIEKLEKEGYVVRVTNPRDKRAYNVFITDKARELKPVLDEILGSWTDILEADLSEEERAMLYVILNKMVNSAMLHMKHSCQSKE
jgi:DNA-binding MarR family transcriptional regulator